jgi:hypothetical protein
LRDRDDPTDKERGVLGEVIRPLSPTVSKGLVEEIQNGSVVHAAGAAATFKSYIKESDLEAALRPIATTIVERIVKEVESNYDTAGPAAAAASEFKPYIDQKELIERLTTLKERFEKTDQHERAEAISRAFGI